MTRLDELASLAAAGDGDATGQWAVDESKWMTDNMASLLEQDALSDYIPNMLALLQTVSDGADQTDAINTLLAMRNDIATSAGLATIAPTPTPAPDATTSPAEAVANLKEWLPDTIKSGDYQVDRWYTITITKATITISAKHSNWVRDIIEAAAFDILYDIIGDLPEDSSYRPTIVIQLRSALDTSYLKVTTPGKYLDSIYSATDPEARWRKTSKFAVSGHLY